MEFEFDKEIDALLRQTAQSESAFADGISDSKFQTPNSEHLAADEISAFAENALPEKAKTYYTAHLADCDACRKNLSNLILLNAETENESVHVEEIAAISSTFPWYQRRFAFPNPAYVMGGLVILFGGIIALTIVQNVNKSSSPELSQIRVESQNSNAVLQNNAAAELSETDYSANANMASNSNAAAIYPANSMTANAPPTPNAPTMNSNMRITAAKPVISPSPPPNEESRRQETADLAKDKKAMQLDGVSAGNVAPESLAKQKPETKKESENEIIVADSTSSTKPQSKVEELPVNGRNALSVAPDKNFKRNSRTNIETKTVGGKIFRQQNNVWTDSAYNGQSTINITRGSKQYKKLDKDLRSIAESFDGAIIVVWKEKAYRIQ